MPFYQDRIYPRLVHLLGDPAPIRRIRHQIIPLAQGKVLEIGAGSGANFVHYDATRVTKLYALEPNPGMIHLAEKQKRQTRLNIEFIGLPGERIPLSDHTMDAVVSTFTLCSVSRIEEVIEEIARVLKPSGELIFCELGLAPDPSVQFWQQLLNPIYQSLFQGLHLTRDIPSLLQRGGFHLKQFDSGYLAAFPKSSSYYWSGVAQLTALQQPLSLSQ